MIKSSTKVGQDHSIKVGYYDKYGFGNGLFTVQIPIADVKYGHIEFMDDWAMRGSMSRSLPISVQLSSIDFLERLEKYQSDIFEASFCQYIPSQPIVHYLRNVTQISFYYTEYSDEDDYNPFSGNDSN